MITRTLGPAIFERIFPRMRAVLTWYYALGYAGLRERYGLPPVRSLYDLIAGDLTLMPDVPEFMPVTDEAPASSGGAGRLDPELAAWQSAVDRRIKQTWVVPAEFRKTFIHVFYMNIYIYKNTHTELLNLHLPSFIFFILEPFMGLSLKNSSSPNRI